MAEIANKWFKQASNCADSSMSNSSSASLEHGSFWGLFLPVGVASVLALMIYIGRFLHEHMHVLRNSNSTHGEK